jgi:hypothetical protein
MNRSRQESHGGSPLPLRSPAGGASSSGSPIGAAQPRRQRGAYTNALHSSAAARARDDVWRRREGSRADLEEAGGELASGGFRSALAGRGGKKGMRVRNMRGCGVRTCYIQRRRQDHLALPDSLLRVCTLRVLPVFQ